MKPWFTYKAIRYLELLINKNMTAFEWGSGASTLWFSKLCNRVTSIEHNMEWALRTADMIIERNNAEVIHIPPLFIGEEREYSLESFTSKEHLHGHIFEAYCRAVEPFNADVYCIDGRARLSCLGVLLPKLKAGNLVIWDNSEREHYTPGLELLEEIAIRYDFLEAGQGGNWQTSLFKIK